MIEARLQAHYAVQWLARYGRSYLPMQKDDSHTSMLWNSPAKLFLSPSMVKGTLALDIPTLTLFWLDPKGSFGTGFSLEGKTDKEVEDMQTQLIAEQDDGHTFSHINHYTEEEKKEYKGDMHGFNGEHLIIGLNLNERLDTILTVKKRIHNLKIKIKSANGLR